MPGEIPNFSDVEHEASEPQVEPLENVAVDRDPEEIYAERMQDLVDKLQKASGATLEPNKIFHVEEIEHANGTKTVIWNGEVRPPVGFEGDSHQRMQSEGFMAYVEPKSGSVFRGESFNELGERVIKYTMIEFQAARPTEAIMINDSPNIGYNVETNIPFNEKSESAVDELINERAIQDNRFWSWKNIFNTENIAAPIEQEIEGIAQNLTSEPSEQQRFLENNISRTPQTPHEATTPPPWLYVPTAQPRMEPKNFEDFLDLSFQSGEQTTARQSENSFSLAREKEEMRILNLEAPLPHTEELLREVETSGNKNVLQEKQVGVMSHRSEVHVPAVEMVIQKQEAPLHLPLSEKNEPVIQNNLPAEITPLQMETDAHAESPGQETAFIEPRIETGVSVQIKTQENFHVAASPLLIRENEEFFHNREAAIPVLQEKQSVDKVEIRSAKEVLKNEQHAQSNEPETSALEKNTTEEILISEVEKITKEKNVEALVTFSDIAHLPLAEAPVALEWQTAPEQFPLHEQIMTLVQEPTLRAEIIIPGEVAPDGRVLDATVLRKIEGEIHYEFRAVLETTRVIGESAAVKEFATYEWKAPLSETKKVTSASPLEIIIGTQQEVTGGKNSELRMENGNTVATQFASVNRENETGIQGIETERTKPWPQPFIVAGDEEENSTRTPSTAPETKELTRARA